jgi:hypothetical protein
VRFIDGFECFAQGGLILFHRHEVIDPVFLNTGSRQFFLGMKRIDKKHCSVFSAFFDQFPSRGNFVALFLHGPGAEEASGFSAKGTDKLEALRTAQLLSVDDNESGRGGTEQVVEAGEQFFL